MRVVLDRGRVVPRDAHVLTDGAPTLHITDDVDIDQLLGDLYARGIQSLIVEGGSLVLSEFIRRSLWQKMIIFVAPMIVGGADAPSLFAVAGSAGSTPVMIPSAAATSYTLRAIGPPVSKLRANGMMPERLSSPR